MSSTTYRIHGGRFLRKYTAAERSSSYAYMADARKIVDSLRNVPWERVMRDVSATMTMHTAETLDWNAPERDRFDAAEWCADHADGMHRVYAQAACYVFELPDSAIGTAIEKIGVNVTSDPYNPYGARISVLTSATLSIPMACETVRTGDVYRAPDANGLGAAPRLYVTNSDGTQSWYSNSEAVELVPSATLAAKKYLFIFVCLENYNRGRNGWIEGSSFIENDVTLTLADACADLDAGELNELAPVRVPATLKLVSLETGATAATLSLSGPVHSMSQIAPATTGGEYNPRKYAVITGDFDEYSVSGMPGFVVYDILAKQILTVTEVSGHTIPATVKAAWRVDGVGARSANVSGVEMMFDFVPSSAAAGVALTFAETSGGLTVSYAGADAIDVTRSAEIADEYVVMRGQAAMRFCGDRVSISVIDKTSGTEWTKPMLPKKQLAFSGSITGIATNLYGDIIVSGSNKIGGDSAAVKVLTPGGDVINFFVDLVPDDFANFTAKEFLYDGGAGILYAGLDVPGRSVSFDSAAATYEKFTTDSAGYHLVTTYGKDNPQTIGFAGTDWPTVSALGGLLLTGRFTSIGGVAANGAAVLMWIRSSTQQDCQLSLHPLDVGPVKRGLVFCSLTSQLPLRLAYMLIEPV